jgi:arylsulfatase
MYWATGAAHAPHQAPAAYLEKYRGRFDGGWDKAREQILQRQIALGLTPKGTRLGPRPDGMPAWDSLSADQKRSYARSMEAFAAYLTYADAEFGRIIAALKAQGELDNTIIVVTSDNGASAEGAHDGAYNVAAFGSGRYPTLAENLQHLDAWGTGATYPHYPLGWAVAGNTPFRYYKATTYEGGIRVPLIIAWDRGIKARGEVRRQFEDIVDLTPTLLAAAGVTPAASLAGAAQTPFDGESMTATFDDPKAAETGRAQYFEMFGNVGIWKAGWKAVIPHRLETWKLALEPPFTDAWELYDLHRDPTETTDLAASEPQRLAEMKAAFEEEARKNNVYPLMNPAAGIAERQKDWMAAFRARKGVWTYTAPAPLIPAGQAPPVLNASYVLTARFDAETAGASGPIVAIGGRLGGVAYYLKDGRPTFAYRDLDGTVTRVSADRPLPAGSHETQVIFERQKTGARVRLIGDGTPLGEGRIDKPLAPNFAVNEILSIAADAGSRVSDDYADTPGFPGRIQEVKFDFNPR